MGIKHRCHRFLLGEPDRPIWRWIAITLLLAQLTACGFPRPPDVGDDATPPRCSRDQDCSDATPFCVNTACAGCRDNTSCPAGRPVCDMVSHDCRTCAKDSECDSGACDLAAGRCVDQGAILYASPTGSNADPCTRMSPCSLRHAAELVDATRPYIVLQPGQYSGGASFDGKPATIAGNNSTLDIIDDTLSLINISNASINIRNIVVDEHLVSPNPDVIGAINASTSDVNIDNMQSTTTHLYAAYSTGNTLTVRRSSFNGPSLIGAQLTVDNCAFHNGGPFVYNAIDMTNSVVVSVAPYGSIEILSSTIFSRSNIVHNTFVGGSGIGCEASSNPLRVFDSNIFYNLTRIPIASGCEYQYNLIVPPANIPGTGNTTGDPLFKDTPHDDFHLQPGSAAIDAANPADVFASHDFDGTPRPQGTRSDIGAFEYVPSQ